MPTPEVLATLNKFFAPLLFVEFVAPAIGAVAFGAWWLRGHLNKRKVEGLEAEIRNLTTQNNNLKTESDNVRANVQMLVANADQRRLFAEEQGEKLTTENDAIKKELAAVQAKLTQAEHHLKQNASKEVVAETIKEARTSSGAAITHSNTTSTILKNIIEIRARDTPVGAVQFDPAQFDPAESSRLVREWLKDYLKKDK